MAERYRRRPGVPFELLDVSLRGASDAELAGISEDLGLALSAHEMRRVQAYFDVTGRDPTDVEVQSLGQAWSEHCCYKSSKVFLREFIFPVQAPYVIDRGDAGVVEFDADHAVALRIESHNHPSAVEPYGGATTGIGGILRDVLAMGAQPIALADPLHFGPLDFPFEKLPKGLKHPKYLFGGVVAGIRDYGNRVGIPTVAGGIVFDPGYVGNILVNVACVGFAKKSQLVRNRVKSARDVFILCGGRTGRDGIHGVTYASVDLTEAAVEEWQGGAVQLGDPILKEPLIHACVEAAQAGLLDGLKDLGGGGLSCVVGELALAGGFGAEVDLEKVPLKEEGLAPWEIWVSESQERMMLAVAPENVDRVLRIFDLYDVPATVIARVIPEKVCRVRHHGTVVLEMDLEFYTGGPEYRRPYAPPSPLPSQDVVMPEEPRDYGKVLLALLGSANIASKEYVIRQYDHEVRASTVLKPLQGVIGKAAHGDAAVLRPLVDSWRGLAVATASTPGYTAIDPFRGGAGAVDEVCRNLVAVGARPHALTNCLNFGNPEKPDRLWSFREAVRGIGRTAQALGVPIPSGNVSFYNESELGAVPPTPVVLGIGIVDDLRTCVTSDFKRAGDAVVLVGSTRSELGGSEYLRLRGRGSGPVPDVDPAGLKASMGRLLEASRRGAVAACHDLSHGGLAVAAAEMCLGGDVGADLRTDAMDPMRWDAQLFSESHGRWLVEVRAGREAEFAHLLEGVPTAALGRVGARSLRIRGGPRALSLGLPSMRKAWSEAIPRQVVVS
uniref:Phosphoribosylformylglycinamidine synthase subunit PurL n=1 Tax=uncultured euryarchaeote Rifle_16ft_4_minimus_23719 TaxID=1665190 RepID=A0A0H4T292_9EURY|nr:phosphoribosylformylglycinamidine synthase II [uncultured euryarchaeote Rifle_16ft_4_minimus_23719]